MRLKIIKNVNPYTAGQVVSLPKGQAELLIKQGLAIKSKDMTVNDMKTT